MMNIFKNLFYFFSLVFIGSLFSEDKPYVLVSVSPHKFFVEKIAGDTIDVGLMVPAGASAHTYEPTPKQILNAGTASIWFRVGEPFEDRAIRAIQSHHPQLWVVDLRKGLNLIAAQCSCCERRSEDLHFWLSARMAKIQAQTIAEALCHLFPNHSEQYNKNLAAFNVAMDKLDLEIQSLFRNLKNKNILVSHPAYAYFCRDYHLQQHSIECEGKDPTPQQLMQVFKLARDWKINTIFIQTQYNNKGARLIADEIGARVVTLDPYAENFIASMLEIAHAFAEAS